MKQLIVKCSLFIVLAMGAVDAAHAQRIFVNVQPEARAVVVRPAPPRPNFVWVEGEYVPNGRTYVYREGYWAPPRAGRVWIPGHWVRERRGWYWIPGFWRRA